MAVFSVVNLINSIFEGIIVNVKLRFVLMELHVVLVFLVTIC